MPLAPETEVRPQSVAPVSDDASLIGGVSPPELPESRARRGTVPRPARRRDRSEGGPRAHGVEWLPLSLRRPPFREMRNMFELIRSVPLRQLLSRQAPALAGSLVIAELFYKFGSFTLECLGFLVTWFVLDAIIAGIARALARPAEGGA